MRLTLQVAILALVVCAVLQRSEGHGIMRVPPGRPSMWREDLTCPVNYDDNAIRCGGRRDKCGVCGDDPDGPLDNELGGKYTKPLLISRTYDEGQAIHVQIVITANHMGWFEFSLCNVDNMERVTEECLMNTVLNMTNGKQHYPLAAGVTGYVPIDLQLPEGVSCGRCVLRWKWKTGNSWGTDPITHQSGIGFGKQEMFFSCADIQIRPKGWTPVDTAPPPTLWPLTRRTYKMQKKTCKAGNLWKNNNSYDAWCESNCHMGNCPEQYCVCTYSDV